MAKETDVFGAQLKQKKRGRIWRGLGIFTLLSTAGVAAYATLTPQGRDTVQMFHQGARTIIEVRQNPDLIFQRAGSNQVNILLIGRDVNWKPAMVWDPVTKTKRPFHVHDKETQARSDTMIVVSLDKTRNKIRMVSLPRDARVYIPENDVETGVTKLNAAHAFGGPRLLIKTLHDELGLTIHHYAVIKFDGFKKLIDQLGGVTVHVDGALKRDRHGKLYRGNLDYDDNWGNLHIHLKPGLQKLNGEQAHNYVRFRMDLEGDPGRIRRQQQVMRALAKEIMQAPPYKVPGLIQEVRRQFETTLGDEQIASAAFFAKRVGTASRIQPLTLFGVYSSKGSVLLNKPKNEALLKTVFGRTFNPDNFLQRSPYTRRGDEIGVNNNASEEARAVLREAGLLEDSQAPRTVELDAPVRVEPSHDEDGDGGTSTRSRRARRTHIADSSSETSSRAVTSNSDDGESPRRRRRLRRRRDDGATRERVPTRTVTQRAEPDDTVREDVSTSSDSSSPVPAPEDSSAAVDGSPQSSTDSGSESPIPQPE